MSDASTFSSLNSLIHPPNKHAFHGNYRMVPSDSTSRELKNCDQYSVSKRARFTSTSNKCRATTFTSARIHRTSQERIHRAVNWKLIVIHKVNSFSSVQTISSRYGPQNAPDNFHRVHWSPIVRVWNTDSLERLSHEYSSKVRPILVLVPSTEREYV